MRIAAMLAGLLALPACAPATTGPGNFAEVCAAQSEMATAGRTDGRPQSITCPR